MEFTLCAAPSVTDDVVGADSFDVVVLPLKPAPLLLALASAVFGCRGLLFGAPAAICSCLLLHQLSPTARDSWVIIVAISTFETFRLAKFGNVVCLF